MPRYATKSLTKLIDEFKRLPGIGPKGAERIALHILEGDEGGARALSQAIVELRTRVGLCNACFNYAEEALCPICQDPSRNQELLCVVEKPKDVLFFESSGAFRGVYHVLHGTLAPLDGIGPDELKLGELKDRVGQGRIKEVILATSPNTEGEATALYAQKILTPLDVTISRIACGVPAGSHIENADIVTLSRSLEGRKEM